ncbi:TPA: hypothetical protein R4057_002040 [Kluyvera ascorbata]|uniref:hypothetical protein n=1 Tax=Kluyvera ascorbata TaxID=51288 RepID=UPI00289A6E29|nr:hypothetical protein [Kluyvera ascorbata]HED3065087.1 hypothetical protein [Kluyvera ascorbata]
MEKINLVYIGPKPFKKDTVTGSRLLFPRGKPVATPSDVAWRLLAHPLVWIREDEIAEWGAEQERLREEAIREAEEQARRDELERQKRDMNCGEYGDIGRLTAAQLRTLVEGAELDVQPQGAQEKVDVYRLRVRDALRAKIAAEGEA